MKIGTQGTKISIFSHFSKVEIYFKQLIVKISNSEICYFGRFIRILRANLNFGSFCETKSGFNFFAGSFFETKSGFKLYFASLGGFFFCAKYQDLKIAVFWPKFTISRVSNKTSHIFYILNETDFLWVFFKLIFF